MQNQCFVIVFEEMVDRVPQHPNFHLERCPRPKQICDHPNNEPDKISHPARASPDSRSTASQIEFAIGTAVGRSEIISQGVGYGSSSTPRSLVTKKTLALVIAVMLNWSAAQVTFDHAPHHCLSTFRRQRRSLVAVHQVPPGNTEASQPQLPQTRWTTS